MVAIHSRVLMSITRVDCSVTAETLGLKDILWKVEIAPSFGHLARRLLRVERGFSRPRSSMVADATGPKLDSDPVASTKFEFLRSASGDLRAQVLGPCRYRGRS